MRRAVWIMYRVLTFPIFLFVVLFGPAWVWVLICDAIFPRMSNQTLYGVILIPMALTYMASLKWLIPWIDGIDKRVKSALLERAGQH